MSEARVTVDGETVGSIGPGGLVLLAVGKDDDAKDAEYMAAKIVNLRVFPDDSGKMQKSLLDVKGEVLLVSQFTLYGDVRKGNRPGFERAAPPDKGLALFNEVVRHIRDMGIRVETGRFGAHMDVSLVNQGPVTILISTQKEF